MNNKQKWLITVRFPSWQQAPIKEAGQTKPMKYPAFGVRYLFETTMISYPEWDEDDERWLEFSEAKVVSERFIKHYERKIKTDWNGEILFIEPFNVVVL